MRNLLLIALTPFLAACPALDVMEGKPSPYKAAHEARAAVLVAKPVVAAELKPPAEPTPKPIAFVEPEPVAEPECVPVWRVVTCP